MKTENTDRPRGLLQLLRFGASSLASFGTDYGLFCLLSAAGLGLVACNVLARVCSSAFNYTLNRQLVFKDKGSIKRSAAGYFALAAVILLLNTLILKGLTLLGLGRPIAKLITEALLFTLSFLVQRFTIFKPR